MFEVWKPLYIYIYMCVCVCVCVCVCACAFVHLCIYTCGAHGDVRTYAW